MSEVQGGIIPGILSGFERGWRGGSSYATEKEITEAGEKVHALVQGWENVYQILVKHRHVFTHFSGKCKMYRYSVKANTDKAIVKPYPIYLCHRDQVGRQIKEWLTQEIIEPNVS